MKFSQLYSRFITHLTNEIALRDRTQRKLGCTLGSRSQLSDEASVENLQQDPAKIAIGEDCFIRGRLLTYAHGGKIRIGDWCYLGLRSEIWSMSSVEIGNRVLIAHNVNIHDGTAHSRDAGERHAHFRHILHAGHPSSEANLPGIRSSPIVIEDDVWISFGVTILQGVRIGAGSIIGAGSLVTCDVPPRTVYRNLVIPQMRSLDETMHVED